MRQELKNIEYIERYLENTLNAADKYMFEQHLLKDAEFRAAVNFQKMLLNQLKEEAFLEDITDYHFDFIASERVKPARFIRRFGWFILFFIITGITILGLILTPNSTIITTKNSDKNTNNKTIPQEEKEIVLLQDIHQKVIKIKNKAFEKPFIKITIQADEGADISIPNSHTVLHLPANAVVDKNGKLITGSFDLQVRILDDQAELASIGLPMNYNYKGATSNLTTLGLIEVRAFKGNKELQLAPNKEISLDYELPYRKSNLKFYHFDKNSETWIASEKITLPIKGSYIELIDSARYWADFEAYEMRKEQNKLKSPVSRDGKKITVDEFSLQPEGISKKEELAPNPNRYLVKHYNNPRLVKALKLKSFGVYNCGQVYKTENQIAIAAEYTDQQKEVIKNAQLLSVIDMNYNAAYSFEPSNFICNGLANNVFLLWTNDKKLYSFVKRSTVKLGTGSYSFTMEDLSHKILNTNDLRAYLKFVEEKIK